MCGHNDLKGLLQMEFNEYILDLLGDKDGFKLLEFLG